MAHPQIHSQIEALELARRYVASLRRSGMPVERAFLFGSFAKKTAHAWSDVDVAVVSQIFGHDRFEERATLTRFCAPISSALEPHPFHPDDLANRWDSLAVEIRRHGIPVD